MKQALCAVLLSVAILAPNAAVWAQDKYVEGFVGGTRGPSVDEAVEGGRFSLDPKTDIAIGLVVGSRFSSRNRSGRPKSASKSPPTAAANASTSGPIRRSDRRSKERRPAKMVKTTSAPARPQPQLKLDYETAIRPKLKKELGLKNVHEVPRLEKIVLNAGLGRLKGDKKVFETAVNTLGKISGQRPKEAVARMSVASFKLRAGQKIGLVATLRGERMYEFLERLIHLVMPRLRDFRGASLKSFDRRGNYSIGFREQAIFPELSFEETNPVHGLQATLVFDSRSPEHSQRLLEEFGFKFEKSPPAGKENG